MIKYIYESNADELIKNKNRKAFLKAYNKFVKTGKIEKGYLHITNIGKLKVIPYFLSPFFDISSGKVRYIKYTELPHSKQRAGLTTAEPERNF